jgi:hypothetical protein
MLASGRQGRAAPDIPAGEDSHVALSDQVDKGKLTDAQAQAQLNADAIQVNQQTLARMSQASSASTAATAAIMQGIGNYGRNSDRLSCSSNTVGGTTFTNCNK